MFKKLLGCRCSSARLCDNKLVLSLENAITPVMWVINLDETPSLLLKVEEAENGLFVLQKLTQGDKGRIAEDLAFYKKKGHAIDAMERAASAMKVRNEGNSGVFAKILRYSVTIIALILVFLTLSYFTQFDVKLMRFIDSLGTEQTAAVEAAPVATAPVEEPRSGVSSNPNAVGVPLSADDFFKETEKPGSGLFY